MTGIPTIDIIFGLAFVYLLFSLLVTTIQEIVATNFGFRAKILERAIVRMLEDEDQFKLRIGSIFSLFIKNNRKVGTGLSRQFYNHPLIKFMGEGKHHTKPSYIKKESFSKVAIDLLRGESARPGDDIQKLIQGAIEKKKANWGNTPIGDQTLQYLKSIWTDAQGDVEEFREHLENWFDEIMERASGWFKKYTQLVLLFISMGIAVLFDVDTLKIADKLNKDPKLRDQLIQQADAFINQRADLYTESLQNKSNTTGSDSLGLADYEQLRINRAMLMARADSLLNSDISKASGVLGLGIGKFEYNGFPALMKSILGWILTALALSMGAPFWFDILNKLMKMRSSVVTTGSTESQAKTDSQVSKIKRKG
jgi:hypothetical protein